MHLGHARMLNKKKERNERKNVTEWIVRKKRRRKNEFRRRKL